MPLALAVLFPLAYALTLVGLRFKWFPHSAWRILLGLFLILMLSGSLAYWTGYQDRAFSMAASEDLDRHQSLALRFLLIWGASLPVLIVAFVWRNRWVLAAHLILLGLLAAQFLLAVRLGKAGGALLH